MIRTIFTFRISPFPPNFLAVFLCKSKRSLYIRAVRAALEGAGARKYDRR